AANTAGLTRAVNSAAAVLQRGGSAVDAAEAAVRSLEDDPCFNAGTGSVANADGVVEMDASIMDGDDLQIGAVAALQGVRSPVSVARAMLPLEEPLLVGEGARRFALQSGFVLDPASPRVEADGGCDTVGCVALDQGGRIAVATSTG